MNAGQPSAQLGNFILSCLNPYIKPGFSERDFVDDGLSPANELRHSGRVRTRRNAKSGTHILV